MDKATLFLFYVLVTLTGGIKTSHDLIKIHFSWNSSALKRKVVADSERKRL